MAGFSALVSYIFKRYVIFGREALSDKRRRYDNNINSDLGLILNNLKLVYKNSTGAKVGKLKQHINIKLFFLI